jgi:uncharacterized protein YuzE
MATLKLDQLLAPLRPLLALSRQIWIDYDAEADVLYLSFRKPQQATDSELEGDIIYHYRNDDLVGLTIMEFQRQLTKNGDITK